MMADQASLACILADVVVDSCQNVVTLTGSSTCSGTATAPDCVETPTCSLFGTPSLISGTTYSYTVAVTQDATYDCNGVSTSVTLTGYATCQLTVPAGLNPTSVFACFAFTPIINQVPDCGLTLSQSGLDVILTAQACIEMKIVVVSQLQVVTCGPCTIAPPPQAVCPVGPFSPPIS